ncbi:putative 2,3-diaminopropionate biosynthesis protein SbnA, partial [Paenibacillus sp. 598K]|uniref:pyridoxal-phosphate dependent enzyme n=1 Tax=Paenibacillus sp. 598K TaxID=1117987 RepID=UPI000FF9F64B
VAVDAEGSIILGGSKGRRLLPGLGAGIVPPLGQADFADVSIRVSEADMVRGCRLLAQREAILAGPSSGAGIWALQQLLPELPDGSVCVVILHDRGERYMDTVYDDEWVREHLGVVL